MQHWLVFSLLEEILPKEDQWHIPRNGRLTQEPGHLVAWSFPALMFMMTLGDTYRSIKPFKGSCMKSQGLNKMESST